MAAGRRTVAELAGVGGAGHERGQEHGAGADHHLGRAGQQRAPFAADSAALRLARPLTLPGSAVQYCVTATHEIRRANFEEEE